MRYVVVAVRLALALTIVGVIAATHIVTASRGPVRFFNFYGYFTIQSNLVVAVACVLAAIAAWSGRPSGELVSLVRAMATTFIVIVGVVYALLLAPLGAAGGVELPWSNITLHMVSPVVMALDWVLVGDRARLSLSRVWYLLIYPLLWSAVVLFRGATDGWVPYPFLDPAQGYGVVAVYVVGIAVAFALVGLAVLAVSRFRGLVLTDSAPVPVAA